MLQHSIEYKQLAFKTVLMDNWYATKDIMVIIDSLDKIFYYPLKNNRLVDDSKGQRAYTAISTLKWSEAEQDNGKLTKINKFPKDYKVQLFRVVVSTHRTDWVVTNDTTQANRDDVRQVCAIRWKIKQLTGIESNQCCKARIHIYYSVLVWICLTRIARQTKKTVYQLKHGLLDNYLCEQLRSPRLIVV